MRKIKSVKLKNDYRDANIFIPRGEILTKSPTGNWFTLENVCNYPGEIILCNKTDLFEIEYEEERKYIDVRIEVPCNFDFFPNIAESLQRKLRIEFQLESKVTILKEGTL